MRFEYPTLYWAVIVNQTSVLTISPHQSTQPYCGWQGKKEIWHSHLIPLSNYAPIWIRSVCLSTETDAEPFVRNINLLIIFLTFIFNIHWRAENLGLSPFHAVGDIHVHTRSFQMHFILSILLMKTKKNSSHIRQQNISEFLLFISFIRLASNTKDIESCTFLRYTTTKKMIFYFRKVCGEIWKYTEKCIYFFKFIEEAQFIKIFWKSLLLWNTSPWRILWCLIIL